MSYKRIDNVLNIGHNLIRKYVRQGNRVLDCTVGNGRDTLLLSKLVGSQGKVYGFDIQEVAITKTRKLLKEKGSKDNVDLILDSHEHIDQYIDEKLDLIIYNLGYLPGGNKNIRTTAATSVKSIKKSLNLLYPNGILLVTVYLGHAGGIEEKEEIEELLINLDQKYYNVLKYQFINQINNPPILYMVEKSKIDQD